MADGFEGLRIHNTLARRKEDFVPADPSNVRLYVCGPTVYDFAHIGNARPAIVFDVLFRLLRHLYGADHVTYVRNITDLDDKINARALRDHGEAIASGALTLNEAIRKVTETTANQYHADVAALGCLPPTHEPRATDFVLPRADGKANMARLIQSLLDKGNAYVATGSEGREVLFDVASMPDYGQLSNRKLEEQQAGARVDVEAHKKNPADFVLWKESGDDHPGWDGVFTTEGEKLSIHGRPGWHIECSAMSEAYLGKTFDIHGGGLDLIFPHHENEIAQSRCAHGSDTMARYWMHNGFLQVEGQKMSKSLGNFVTIHEVLEYELPVLTGVEQSEELERVRASWNGLSARFSMLQTHYREPIDWTHKRLVEASDELYRWYELLRSAHFDTELKTEASKDVVDALSDDLNTWQAITLLRRYAKEEDVRALGEGMAQLGLLAPSFVRNDDVLIFDRAAGLGAGAVQDIDERIQARLALIAEKSWAEADKIRDDLLAEGIQLKDSKDSETGERMTTWEVKR